MKRLGMILREMGFDREFLDLARRVDANVADRRNPDRFHEEKSEIVEKLKQLSKGDII